MRGRWIIAVMMVAACGDGHVPITPTDDAAPPDVDAPPSNTGPCWPEEPTIPQGTITLGAGLDAFEPMTDELPLEYGIQQGFMVLVRVRMTGLSPGNPNNVLDPSNPRTRIRAFFDETDVPLNVYSVCPFRYGYRPTATPGQYEIDDYVPIVFETCWRSDNLIGKRIRIEADLIDPSLGHASDVRVVTAVAPVGAYPVDMDSEGCVRPDSRR